MIIPDWLTYTMILSGVTFHLLNGDGVRSSISCLVAGGIFLIPALFGQVGMGDVKWMAGVGAWTSIPFVLLSFAFASVIGLLFIFGILIWKIVVKKRKYKEVRKEPIPYAVTLGGGILAGLLILNVEGIINLSL
jgi:Flp pilus assembly protein protease CpaA